MIITREWAMPSKHTFKIIPISKLIHKYVKDGLGWIDPFAGENSPAEYTNDLNPDKPTKYHLPANEFVSNLNMKFAGTLFDPPYSTRQTKECYESIGVEFNQKHKRLHLTLQKCKLGKIWLDTANNQMLKVSKKGRKDKS